MRLRDNNREITYYLPASSTKKQVEAIKWDCEASSPNYFEGDTTRGDSSKYAWLWSGWFAITLNILYK